MAMVRYILLVGEGNFSFAAEVSTLSNDLMKGSEAPLRIIATDFKSQESQFIEQIRSSTENFQIIPENIDKIKSCNGTVLLDVDATKLETHDQLLTILKRRGSTLSKIVFNFPHVKRKKMHIGLNRELLKNFFQSANKLIQILNKELTNSDNSDPIGRPESAEILVSLCSGQSGVNEIEAKARKWADSWQIVEQAAYGNFVLKKVDKFSNSFDFIFDNGSDYTNCGYRDRSHAGFNGEGANTFTFIQREELLPDFKLVMNELVDFNSLLPKLLGSLNLTRFNENNPLLKLIQQLDSSGDTSGVKLRLEFDPKAVTHPFVHLWADDLPLCPSLEVLCQEFDSVLNFQDFDPTKSFHLKLKNGLVVGKTSNNSNEPNRLSLNISQIISSKYHFPDSRLLFSKYCTISKNDNTFALTTGSLFPLEHSWDLSLWTTELESSSDADGSERMAFSPERFTKCVFSVYTLLLKSISLRDVYKDLISGRVSHCYRIVIQSLDRPLSKDRAHQYHQLLRQLLVSQLTVELR